MKIFTPSLIACLLIAAGCANDSAITGTPRGSSLSSTPLDESHCPCAFHVGQSNLTKGDASEPYQLNDMQITSRIELAAGQMIAKKQTTKSDELRKQLSREKCKIDRLAAGPNDTTPTNLYEKHRASVLVMTSIYKCGRCSRWHLKPASGFVISEDGKAVTNYHVIDGKDDETYVAMTGDGKVYAVKEVLAASEKNDLAIVQLDTGGDKLKPLAITPNTPVGSNVNLISHPDKRFYTMTRGIVSRYFKMDNPKKKLKDIAMMAITADFAKGSSGAPLLNDKGQVIGIVTSTVSVYYNAEKGDPRNLQMVFKQCIPAASLLQLIE